MRFNRFVWELYAQSDRGEKALKKFSRLDDGFVEPSLRTYPLESSDEFKDQFAVGEVSINVPALVHDAVSGRDFRDLESASRYFREKVVPNGIPFEMADKTGKKEVAFVFPEDDGDWHDYVEAISLGLHRAKPEFFLPYNFRCKFNQVEEIHAEFGIPMPAIPGKRDKLARGLYYLDINAAWQEFRTLHGLSPAEMCAFLYDFAPQFTTPLDASDLPSPSKAWFITGGSWDIETADAATGDTVSLWGGNESVRRGDILVMYLVKPRSCIHSVWRACSDGFFDPFFHYPGTVWICSQVKTAPVTYAELKQDALLSKMAAVRGSFLGPTGKGPLTVEEYEAILAIMETKGQDTSSLPRIPRSYRPPSGEILNERDVEDHLIEPFLKKLGYEKSDWVRQLSVRMGRGERNYPDYAFGAKAKKGEETAKMVLESKFQLSAQREFRDAFLQTKSYALRLRSAMMVMAAREGIWVFPPDGGDFSIKKYTHKSWDELTHPDAFHELLCLMGRDKILGRASQGR